MNILIAGFGGQGILFAGKLLAYTGMLAQKQVTWLPSYGPEMRGGTANCHVVISDELIGSPIITQADVLVVMNRPSLEKFEGIVSDNGLIISDSSLVDKEVQGNVRFVKIPATEMAMKNGASKLANMILMGKLIKETGILKIDEIFSGIKSLVSASKPELCELNIKMSKLGYDF